MDSKILKFLFSLVLSLLMGSCVLTMEDYTQIPEEQRGMDEPYTYEDSLITCTYKYRKGVTPVTNRWFPYVIGVKDSTLYVIDDIPSDWLPQTGGYVVAGCSRTFPGALCHQVTSIQHKDGMYAMELKIATIDDVYEQFDVEVDFDNYEVPGMEMTDDTTSQGKRVLRITRGGKVDPHFAVLSDGSVIDFTYVDEAQETGNRYLGPCTREEIYTDDYKVKDEETTKIQHWEHTFSYDKLDTKIKGKNVSLTPTLSLTFDKTYTVKAHKEERKSIKWSEEWNEVYGTSTFTGKLSFGAGIDFVGNTLDKEKWRMINECRRFMQAQKKSKLRMAVDPRIAYIGSPNFPIYLRLHFGLEFSGKIEGSGEIKITSTDKVERIKTVRNGDEDPQMTKELVQEASTDYTFKFGGCAEIGAEVRLGIGFIFGTLGTGVGVDIGVGVEVKGTADVMTAPIDVDSPIDTVYNQSGLHLTGTLFADFEVFADFAGEPVAHDRVAPKNMRFTFLQKNLYFFPRVDNKLTYGIYKYDYSDPQHPKVKHTRHLVFSSDYLWNPFSDKPYPVLIVYTGSLNSKPKVLSPNGYTGSKSKVGDKYPLEVDQVYSFYYESDPMTENKIWFVPGLMHENGAIDEYRAMNNYWGGGTYDGGNLVTHLETYQRSTDEQTDHKMHAGEEYDFYKVDDIIELGNVPEDYVKVGYQVSLVDSHGRTAMHKRDVNIMMHMGDTKDELRVKTGIYKVSFTIGLPTSGRQRVINPLMPSLKAYPIITLVPYYEVYLPDKQKYQKYYCEEKSIKLEYPCTNDYTYKKANFTKTMTIAH